MKNLTPRDEARNEALQSRFGLRVASALTALGASLGKALWLAVEVETLARLYVQALALGDPPVLDDAEMGRVLEQMRRMSYGLGPEGEGAADPAHQPEAG